MGRKVLLAVICWLNLSHALGEPKNGKKPGSVVAIDNESAESAPRSYGPLHVYASAVPYTTNKFKGHSVIAAGSQIIPVKHSNQGLTNLKDSYGKYVQTHQSAYMPTYPQQFVPLQDLPPHLAQPLVSAAAPSFNFKTAPNYFYGPHSYKIQELQLPPHQAAQFGSISQPLVYANDLKSFAPSNLRSTHELHTPQHKLTITTHNKAQNSNQPLQYAKNSKYQTIHQTHHLNEPSHHSNHQVYASTSQKFYEKPQSHISSFVKDTKQQGSQHQSGEIQASPAQTQITAIVNGKKTVVNLETKPPLPLLDLNLLEPLKFDNPLVPQLQHFLPRVKGATYHKLPSQNVKKGKNKEFVITKTKSYDSGAVKSKTYLEPKKNKSQPKPKLSKPGITVKGHPDSGDFSYEINTPNHKETYNEQVVKYDKETNMKPVEYSYHEQTHKEPEVYTIVHSSKEPLKITHVEYNSDDDGPKHLVYNLSQEDKNDKPSNKVNQPTPQVSNEDSGENDSEEDDGPPPPSTNHNTPRYPQHDDSNAYHEAPKHSQHDERNSYHGGPKYSQHDERNTYHEAPKHSHHDERNTHHDAPENSQHNEHPIYHSTPKNVQHDEYNTQKIPAKEYYHHSEYNSESPKHLSQPNYYVKGQVPVPPKHHPQPNYYVKSQASPPSNEHHQNVFIIQETPNFQVNQDVPLTLVHHEPPRQSHHLNVEHRGHEYNQKPSQDAEHQVIQGPFQHQVVQHFTQPINLYQPITPEYEEDIRILPTHSPVPHSAPIKVDPSQHLPGGPTVETFINNRAQEEKHASPQKEHHSPRPPYSSQQPYVEEKSRHIIIKENQETPDEKHMHTEQLMNEMSDREENSEEDFEKGYKESAFGFPAYEEIAEDVEKDIFDPDSYGNPVFKSSFNAESSPFQQYEKEDDKFPKFSRLAYKDSKDNNQEDYFLDYALHKPESYTDRMKSKVEYYKMFKKNRPEKIYYGQDEDRKEKSAKFTIAPSFDFFKPKQSKNVMVKYKMPAPIRYAYDYGHETPKDSSAYASHPTYNKYKTHFVEPQLQYGFEPITAPMLFIESEMAGVASNNSPESKTPGTRKKLYSEKWYMKKTTTNSKPS